MEKGCLSAHKPTPSHTKPPSGGFFTPAHDYVLSYVDLFYPNLKKLRILLSHWLCVVHNSSMAKTNRHRLTASTARHRIAMGLQDPDRLAWVPGDPACSGISGICSNQAGKRWTLLLPRPQQPRAHKTRWCCTHRELKTVAKTGREKYRAC